MKTLILITLLLMPSIASAGISVCFDVDNSVKDFSLRGNPMPSCAYYSIGLNGVTQAKYDTVRNLLQTVERRYLKKLGNDPVEMSPAEKVAVDDAFAALVETEYRTNQKANFDGANGVYLRALVKVLLDENNTLRQWITSFKTQVAASSNLADFKTRVAALPSTPDRTLDQAKTAIVNAIDTKAVDE